MPDTIIDSILTGKLNSQLVVRWLNKESFEDVPEDCVLLCNSRSEFVACFLSYIRNQTDSILQTNNSALQIRQRTPDKVLHSRRKHKRSISDPTSDDRTDSLSVKPDRRSHESPSKDRKRGRKVKTKLFNEERKEASISSDESRLSSGMERMMVSSTPMKNGLRTSESPVIAASPVTPRLFTYDRCDTPRLAHRKDKSVSLGDFITSAQKTKKRKSRNASEENESKIELDISNTEVFPEISRKASSLRSEKRRIKPTNLDSSMSQKSFSLNSFTSECFQQSSPLALEENKMFKQPKLQPKELSNSFDAERNILKLERQKLMEKFNLNSSTTSVPVTPQIKIIQKDCIEKTLNYVNAELSKVVFKEKIDLLIELYDVLLKNNLILSLNSEIYFLISILLSKQVEEDYLEIEDKLTEKNFTNYLLTSIHNCTYFAIKSLWNLRSILEIVLDKNSLKILGENKKVRGYSADLAKFLLNCYGLKCEAESQEKPRTVDKRTSNGIVCFNLETDNAENFPSLLSFQNFKKQRDMFYEILRWYTEQSNTGVPRSTLRARVKTLVGAGHSPANHHHLAALLVAHMLAECLHNDQESKLSKLQRRLTCAAGDARLPHFTEKETFYKELLVNAGSESFRAHVRDALASELITLDSTPLQHANNSDISRDFLHLQRKLYLLAKFLGFLASLPYVTLPVDSKTVGRGQEMSAEPKERVLQSSLKIRSYSQPALDLQGLLQNAINSSRVTVTVPWLAHYLSMLEHTSLRLPYYRRLMTSIASVRRPRPSGATAVFLHTVLGWLFDLPHIPQDIYETLDQPDNSPDNPNSTNHDNSNLDNLDLIDEAMLFELCPYLKEINVLLSTCKVDKKETYRHITPVSLSVNSEERVRSKEKELQLRLEEELIKSQPSSTRRVLELVIERVTAACVRDLTASVNVARTRAREDARKAVAERGDDLQALLKSLQALYLSHLARLRESAQNIDTLARASGAMSSLLPHAPKALHYAAARAGKVCCSNYCPQQALLKSLQALYLSHLARLRESAQNIDTLARASGAMSSLLPHAPKALHYAAARAGKVCCSNYCPQQALLKSLQALYLSHLARLRESAQNIDTLARASGAMSSLLPHAPKALHYAAARAGKVCCSNYCPQQALLKSLQALYLSHLARLRESAQNIDTLARASGAMSSLLPHAPKALHYAAARAGKVCCSNYCPQQALLKSLQALYLSHLARLRESAQNIDTLARASGAMSSLLPHAPKALHYAAARAGKVCCSNYCPQQALLKSLQALYLSHLARLRESAQNIDTLARASGAMSSLLPHAPKALHYAAARAGKVCCSNYCPQQALLKSLQALYLSHLARLRESAQNIDTLARASGAMSSLLPHAPKALHYAAARAGKVCCSNYCPQQALLKSLQALYLSHLARLRESAQNIDTLARASGAMSSLLPHAPKALHYAAARAGKVCCSNYCPQQALLKSLQALYLSHLARLRESAQNIDTLARASGAMSSLLPHAPKALHYAAARAGKVCCSNYCPQQALLKSLQALYLSHLARLRESAQNIDTLARASGAMSSLLPHAPKALHYAAARAGKVCCSNYCPQQALLKSLQALYLSHLARLRESAQNIDTLARASGAMSSLLPHAPKALHYAAARAGKVCCSNYCPQQALLKSLQALYLSHLARLRESAQNIDTLARASGAMSSLLPHAPKALHYAAARAGKVCCSNYCPQQALLKSLQALYLSHLARLRESAQNIDTLARASGAMSSLLPHAPKALHYAAARAGKVCCSNYCPQQALLKSLQALYLSHLARLRESAQNIDTLARASGAMSSLLPHAPKALHYAAARAGKVCCSNYCPQQALLKSLQALYLSHLARLRESAQNIDTLARASGAMSSLLPHAPKALHYAAARAGKVCCSNYCPQQALLKSLQALYLSHLARLRESAQNIDTLARASGAMSSLLPHAPKALHYAAARAGKVCCSNYCPQQALLKSLQALYLSHLARLRESAQNIDTLARASGAMSSLLPHAPKALHYAAARAGKVCCSNYCPQQALLKSLQALYLSHLARLRESAQNIDTLARASGAMSSLLPHAPKALHYAAARAGKVCCSNYCPQQALLKSLQALYLSHLARLRESAQNIDTLARASGAMSSLLPHAPKALHYAAARAGKVCCSNYCPQQALLKSLQALYLSHLARLRESAQNIDTLARASGAMSSLLPHAPKALHYAAARAGKVCCSNYCPQQALLKSLQALYLSHLARLRESAQNIDTLARASGAMSSLLPHAPKALHYAAARAGKVCCSNYCPQQALLKSLQALYLSHLARLRESAQNIDTLARASGAMSSLLPHAPKALHYAAARAGKVCCSNYCPQQALLKSLQALYLSHLARLRESAQNIDTLARASGAMSSLLPHAPKALHYAAARAGKVCCSNYCPQQALLKSLQALYLSHLARLRESAQNIDTLARASGAMSSLLPHAPKALHYAAARAGKVCCSNYCPQQALLKSLQALYLSHLARLRESAQNIDTLARASGAMSSLLPHAPKALHYAAARAGKVCCSNYCPQQALLKSLQALYLSHLARLRESAQNIDTLARASGAMSSLLPHAPKALHYAAARAGKVCCSNYCPQQALLKSLQALYLSHLARLRESAQNIDTLARASGAMSSLLPHAPKALHYAAARAGKVCCSNYCPQQALLKSLQALYLSHLARLRESAQNIDTLARASGAMSSLLPHAPKALHYAAARAGKAAVLRWARDHWTSTAVLCKDIEAEMANLITLGDAVKEPKPEVRIDSLDGSVTAVSVASAIIHLKEQVCLLLEYAEPSGLSAALATCALACSPANLFGRGPQPRAILQLSVDLCVVFVSRKPKEVNEAFLNQLHAIWNVCCPDRKKNEPQDLDLPEKRDLTPELRNFEDDRAPTPVTSDEEDVPTKTPNRNVKNLIITPNPKTISVKIPSPTLSPISPFSLQSPISPRLTSPNSLRSPKSPMSRSPTALSPKPKSASSKNKSMNNSSILSVIEPENTELLEFFDRILCPRNIVLLNTSKCKSAEVWEALAGVLVFLLKFDYLSEDSLTEQCLAVYRQDWHQSVLESLSTCMKAVSSRWTRSSGKFTLFLDFLAEYCGDLELEHIE